MNARRPSTGAVVKGAILAALLVVAFVCPYVLGSYYVSLLSIALIAAILASSINVLAGNAGLVSLGHAGIAAASGYGLAWAYRQGWELWAQLGMAALLTAVASVLYGLISMRTRGISFLMVTLAAGMVVYGMAYRWSSVTGGTNGLPGIRRPEGIAEYWQFYFLVLVAFCFVTLALIVVGRSSFGLTLRGIRDSETRMVSLGYNVPLYKFGAMLVSGAVAGVAGVLAVWHSEFISPVVAGFQESAISMIMVALGGIGTVLGPLVGAVLVTGFQHVLSSVFERWSTLLGLIFILSVIFAPQGIVGGVADLMRRIRRRGAPPRREQLDAEFRA
ncbi:MAG: branched-chain amino acid ABC transporter permease [Microbacteriaceae bacterium]|nr:branched-chain amino acid ABC transporter permease [Microbacteriaceae bacterium]